MATTNQIPVACFAPPLTDKLLASYRGLIDGLGPDQAEVKDALQQCLRCVEAWWALPESKRQDGARFKTLHRGQEITYHAQPLEAEHVRALWDVTPWMKELNLLSNAQDTGLFDGLEGDLRNAAFHLLWHAKEITLDREPLTSDKL